MDQNSVHVLFIEIAWLELFSDKRPFANMQWQAKQVQSQRKYVWLRALAIWHTSHSLCSVDYTEN